MNLPDNAFGYTNEAEQIYCNDPITDSVEFAQRCTDAQAQQIIEAYVESAGGKKILELILIDKKKQGECKAFIEDLHDFVSDEYVNYE